MSNLSSLLDRYKALVIFDTETSGLNPGDDQIIELAALRVERTQAGALRIAGKMDTFIRLPEGERLPENIVTLTGITDRLLETEGVQSGTAVSRFLKLVKPGPVLMVAHNAQFDACFLRELLRGFKPGHLDWLDSLTVYKDRRPYPHKLANAILAYELEDKVQNSHRAIDDVLALFEVLKAMDEERDDLGSYVNLFGYNPKYGVSIHILTGALKDVPRDEEIVVLSMYDGIGTGRYCLEKMGFTNVTYYAYEIDGPAMKVALSNYPDIIQCGDAFDLRRDDWELGKRFSKDQPTEKSTEAARDGDATDPADAPSDANLPTREECDETESREEAPRQRNEFDDDVIDILLELRDERYQLSQINSKNRRYSFEVRALEYAVSILEVVT